MSPNTPESGEGPQAPPTKVEDIFNTVEKPTAQEGQPQAPKPMSSEKPMQPGVQATPPKMGGQFPPQGGMPAQPVKPASLSDASKGSKKGLLTILIVIIAFVVIGGGAYGVYWYMTQQDAQTLDTNTTVNTNTSALLNTNTSALNTNTTASLNTNTATTNTNTSATLDTDGDGLTDAEEVTYKTNPKLTDSDIDGLTDYDEVMTYETDPNDADTDSDGYLDGEEVKNGYNPNGTGKLTETKGGAVSSETYTSSTLDFSLTLPSVWDSYEKQDQLAGNYVALGTSASNLDFLILPNGEMDTGLPSTDPTTTSVTVGGKTGQKQQWTLENGDTLFMITLDQYPTTWGEDNRIQYTGSEPEVAEDVVDSIAFTSEASANESNTFSYDTVTVGDKVAGMEVVSIEPYMATKDQSETNVKITFSGTTTIEGVYSGVPTDGLVNTPQFTPDSDQLSLLPKMEEDERTVWFRFSNNDAVEQALGTERREAAITIDSYVIALYPSEVSNMAQFISVAK